MEKMGKLNTVGLINLNMNQFTEWITSKVFLNDTYENVIKSGYKEKDLYWFKFPTKNTQNIDITHYSYFEDWNHL